MKFRIRSEIHVPGIGWMGHTHEQEFDDDSNVFGRVYEYRQYIYKTFPGCDYKLISAKQVKNPRHQDHR